MTWSCIFVLACSIAQNTQQSVGKQININTATVDAFGHVYYANQENEVLKIDRAGNRLGYYSNNRLGMIGYIDVTNPLKVLVFYPDFYTIVFLDRQLNETGRFDMIDLGFGEVRMVASSRDGTIWIFDDHNQRLKKINQQGQILLEGEDLRLLFNERLRPVKIKEYGNQIYVNIPGSGIWVFDLFGQYQNRIEVSELVDFQCIADLLVFTHDDRLEFYNPRDFLSRKIPLSISMDRGKYLVYNQKMILITDQDIRWLDLPDHE